MNAIALVLTTINAPYARQLSAPELALCLLDCEEAKAVAGHVSSFFGEVSVDLQIKFAKCFNISQVQLEAAAKAFSSYSGEHYPLAA
jgi:hypothetical protein